MQAIGGYFELGLPSMEDYYPDALKFQSARAAFFSLLQVGKPSRVWIPSYICDAMISPILRSEIECVFYDIGDQFNISDQIHLTDDDWLIYVNYFGICSENITRILNRYNTKQIVLDYSQAFFSPPQDTLATIYSPRKFFGVPDGGLLYSQLQVSEPEIIDTTSLNRMGHLLKRLAEDSPEAGYADFQRAEKSLQNMELRRMSSLTRRLLLSQNFEGIRQKRNDNFRFLHKSLEEFNLLKIHMSDINGPLCYPFFSEKEGLRKKLIAKRIFVPTYWQDVLARVDKLSFEFKLVKECLPLPIDQRYNFNDLQRIIDIILEQR